MKFKDFTCALCTLQYGYKRDLGTQYILLLFVNSKSLFRHSVQFALASRLRTNRPYSYLEMHLKI